MREGTDSEARPLIRMQDRLAGTFALQLASHSFLF